MKFTTIFVAAAAFAASAIAQTINTPGGIIAIGATTEVTFASGGATGNCQIQVRSQTTQGYFTVASSIPITSSPFPWTVNVTAGSYVYVLTPDGANPIFSAPFNIGGSGAGATTGAASSAVSAASTATSGSTGPTGSSMASSAAASSSSAASSSAAAASSASTSTSSSSSSRASSSSSPSSSSTTSPADKLAVGGLAGLIAAACAALA